MNETSKRIQAYKEALPGLRERVFGVALLLVMSLVMMTSATFAWVTLSAAPEVAGTATTVTANGNLELALSDTDGEEPEESAVGDSSKNQSVLQANLTWGNLVNLSDASYGLDHLQLRPAMLGDTTDLLNTPLASVNFGQDGRVQEGYNYDLAFTNWNATDSFFEYSDVARYGVRAISTIEYKIQDATYEKYRTLLQTANYKKSEAISVYRGIMGSNDQEKNPNENVEVIAGLMGDYMTYRLNSYEMSTLDVTKYVKNIYVMMYEFQEAYTLTGDALAQLANIQIFLKKGAQSYEQYAFADGDAMWLHDANGKKTALDWATLNSLGIKLDALVQYEKSVRMMQTDLEIILNFYDPATEKTRGAYDEETQTYASSVYWTDIQSAILDLVYIPTCTVAASATDTPIEIQSLGRSAATGLLGKDIYAVIKKGLLVDFENLICDPDGQDSQQINLSGVDVSAKYIVTVTMTAASIKTAAYGTTSAFTTDRNENCAFDSGGDTSSLLQGSAQDTYGMAVDLWVRTNAADSYLILEGNVLTETSEPIPATLTLSSGDVVSLYSATITYPKDESDEGESGEDDALNGLLGNKETVDVYSLDPNGTPDDTSDDVWYFADTHGLVYQTATTYTYTEEYSVTVAETNGNKTVTVTKDGAVVTDDIDLYIAVEVQGDDATTDEVESSYTGYISITDADVRDEPYTELYIGTTTFTTKPTRGESISISSAPKTYTTSTVIGYEGENRVWQENSLLTVNSTTQGSGSCYVFYADNPTDQQNSLKLLSNLRVAFLSSAGGVMAMAKLDTENTYADSGKVTVPLVLTSGSNAVYTAEGDLAITALEQNEATWITMIVYLEGKELTNDQVLAANEIQGKLNVQFGSSVGLQTMGDEALESAEMHVSADVDKTSFDYANDDDMTVNVTVTVDGDEPNSVTAFFLRQVNETQGSREETMIFTPNGDGTWSASYTFTAPGTYVLRSVQLDGQDYDLDSQPKVEIAGLDYAVSCTLSAAVLTGERTYTTGENALQVTINTNDPDKMPRSVQLQFINNATKDPVTALMSYDSSTNTWKGKATFTASGSYTLTYVILDGDYFELKETQKKSFYLTLGVSVRVRDRVDNPNKEYNPEGYTLDMLVDIYNEAGEVLANLQNTRLYYGKQGSAIDSLDTDLKWDASEGCYTGRFLLKKTGIYSFTQVTISSSSSITRTTNTPPVYTMLDPDPPAFVSDATTPYQLMKSGSAAVIKFTLENTGSAGVIATVKNTSTGSTKEIVLGESSVLEEELENGEYVYHYTVTLPDDLDTTGVDGVWQLTGLKLSSVYDENKVFYYGAATGEEGYEEDKYLVWNLTADENVAGLAVTDANGEKVTSITTEVQTPKLKVTGNTEYLTGKTFRSAYTNRNKVTLTVTDAFDNALNDSVNMGNATVKYNWKDASDANKTAGTAYTTEDITVSGNAYKSTYGTDSSGTETVTSAVLTAPNGTVEVTYGAGHDESYISAENNPDIYSNYTLTYNGNGTYTLAAGEIKLNYAGVYTCESIKVVINGNEYNFTSANAAQMPKYVTQTELPVVKVTGVSPSEGATHRLYTGTIATDGSVSADDLITGDFFHYSDFFALVFIYAGDSYAYNVYLPQVTLALSGITNFTSASMVFPSDSSSTEATFSFTPSALSSGAVTIGGKTDGTAAWLNWGTEIKPKIFPIGKQTVDELKVNYGGNNYTFTLDNAITINNPQYPPYADFTDIASINDTYTGATPSRVYSEDGETIKLTLDKIQWSRSGIETGNDVTYGNWNSTILHTDYGYKDYDYWWTNYKYYKPYNWTKFTRQVTGTQTPYTTTYTIDKWIVDGVEYAASSTPIYVEADGPITVTAVVTSNTVWGATVNATSTETVYGYVAGDETSTKPNGKQIGDTMGRWDSYPEPSLGLASVVNNAATSQSTNVYDSATEYENCTNRAS